MMWKNSMERYIRRNTRAEDKGERKYGFNTNKKRTNFEYQSGTLNVLFKHNVLKDTNGNYETWSSNNNRGKKKHLINVKSSRNRRKR